MIRRIIEAILSAVATAGDRGVPDGELYAMLQSILGDVWTLDVHTAVIAQMVKSNRLTNEHHLLRIGSAPVGDVGDTMASLVPPDVRVQRAACSHSYRIGRHSDPAQDQGCIKCGAPRPAGV